jgi:multidrug resistance efflux pump
MSWLMVFGLLLLVSSMTAISLTFHPWSKVGAPVGSATPPGTRRAVAVAYVDVEGGVRSLYPAVTGRVVSAPVPEGKEVEEGTVLLCIDDTLAQARLKEAKVEMEAAEERLAQARKRVSQHKTTILMQQAALDAAKNKVQAAEALARKTKNAYDKDLGGSAEDVEAANQLVAEARAGVRVQQNRLNLFESADPQSEVRLSRFDIASKTEHIEKAELGVRECKILAPCKGVILRRLVNVGEVLGMAANRPAIEFCPSSDRIVRAEVEQEFAGKLFKGQKATISDDITGLGEWHGEVLRISDWYMPRRAVLLEPMQYNDIRTLEVILRLENNPKDPLRINQRVRVRLEGQQ